MKQPLSMTTPLHSAHVLSYMDLDKYDAFYNALSRGEQVNRHQHNVPSETMRELERMDIISRDEDGFHVAGPMFEVLNSEF